MKIEDIKPGDVIVRTEDKILFKVVEVTSDRQIMQSAKCKLNEVFCIFQEPKPIPFCSVYEFEPATEEQRQYMDSKLSAFNGTHTDAESNRITALAFIIGDLKQEYNALAERVEADEKVKEYKNRLRFVFRHYRRFIHADFVSMEHDCPHGVKAKVGSLKCIICEHYIKSDSGNAGIVLCAYDYDKEKEEHKPTQQ